MVRILHLNNERTWRGGERQTLLLAAGLRDCGIRSVIGCRPGGLLEQKARAAAVETLRIPGNNFGAAMTLARVAGEFDLVHCHTGRGHSLAALPGVCRGTPFLVTRRVDFTPPRNWYNRHKFERAARVVCISRFIAEQMARWGVSRERLAVVPSTVPLPDPKLLTPEHRAGARARLQVGPGLKLVGNIAALVGHKDHATLLRAARTLTEGRSDIRLVILGDGELRDSLLALRRDLGLEEMVLMPGFVPDAERYLPAFDVFAMSSCMEGLGSIVLDAFAAGLPVAATAGGGLPELVRNEETGLLVPVGDAGALAGALNRLIEGRLLAERLGAAARDLVARDFSVGRMVGSYEELYRSIPGR
jgi:glycosyltransferase involved in cell wall biosynthesis